MALLINLDYFPTPSQEYVAWLDVMGTAGSMSRSVKSAANFMLKLHIAALNAPHNNVRLYPIMDGLYASSPSQTDMLAFLGHVFHAVAGTFTESPNHFRFIIRGALAYGDIVHGGDLPPMLSMTLNTAQEYRGRILIGQPMIDSHLTEKCAPPFGIFVHESAQQFSSPGNTPIQDAWWKWGNAEYHTVWTRLRPCMINYYDWCAKNSQKLNYPKEKITQHKELMEQYLK